MKQLAIILFVALTGTMAHTAPLAQTPAEFGDILCAETKKAKYQRDEDPSNAMACYDGLKANSKISEMNFYEVARHVCHEYNYTYIHEATCLGIATLKMRNESFKEKVAACGRTFWTDEKQDVDVQVKCQRDVFDTASEKFKAFAAKHRDDPSATSHGTSTPAAFRSNR